MITEVAFDFLASSSEPTYYNRAPSVDLRATPTLKGYKFEITSTSRTVPSDCYGVAVVQDGTPIWSQQSGFPKNVTKGNIGIGPAGEYLNFTDSDHDGKLGQGGLLHNGRIAAQHGVRAESHLGLQCQLDNG